MNDRSLDGLAAIPSGTAERITEGRAVWRLDAARGGPEGAPTNALGKLLRWSSAPLYDLISTLFPALCLVCDEPLVGSGRVPVCVACLRAPKSPGGLCCQICGDALGYENARMMEHLARERQLCTPCRLAPPPFRRAVAAAVYDGPTRELLHLLKYDGVRSLARPLGALLADAMEKLVPEFAVDGTETLLVPVPLFRGRRRERGFNQAALLAQAVQLELRRRHAAVRPRVEPELLERTRATESQFALNPAQRRRNMRGAFAVAKAAAVAGRDVVLIDDIYTTGATARACAQVLARAGARAVWVATVARAQPETVAMWDAPADVAMWTGATAGGGF